MTNRRFVLLGMLASLCAWPSSAFASERSRRRRGRYIVTLREGDLAGAERRVRRYLARRNYPVLERLQYVPMLVVSLDERGAAALRRHPDVVNVQSDGLSSPMSGPGGRRD